MKRWAVLEGMLALMTKIEADARPHGQQPTSGINMMLVKLLAYSRLNERP